MVIRFDKIHLHNFVSFIDTEIHLSDAYCTLITGKNSCSGDNAKSNGSGKSSIFNALCYALTGETTQGVSSGIENIYGDPQDCWVELTFHVDNDEFIIKRVKSPRQMLFIKRNGEDISGKGIKESGKILEAYLPDIDADLLCNIIILGQGMPGKLSKFNPAGRKGILEKLTRSDEMVAFIKDKLEDRQARLKSNLRSFEDFQLATNATISAYKSRLNTVTNELRALGDFETEQDIENEINRLDQVIKSCDEELSAISAASTKANIMGARSLLSKLQIEKSDSLRSNAEAYADKLNKFAADEAEKNAVIRGLKTDIKKLKAIVDICPTCGQKLVGVDKPDTTELEDKLTKLEEELVAVHSDKLHVENEKAEAARDIEKKFETDINAVKKTITDLEAEERSENDRTNTLRSNIKNLSNKLFELKSLKLNYVKATDEIANMQSAIEELTKQKDEKSAEIAVVNSRLLIMQQLITLAKREFRGAVLSNVIDFVNSRVQYYSKVVFGNDGLTFTLCDNKIDIAYNGRMYENLSGGEQQKVDIIIQLALRDMLLRQLNVKANILVCDEIFDNLDSEGAARIIDVIQNRSEIESVFFITHHAESLGISFDRELVVHKNELGVSDILAS